MNAGVYIHIPFCRSRCSYCDFATGMYQSEIAETYVSAVCSEIRGWREIDQPAPVDTIYFGGGTPSLLSAEQIERILDSVTDRFEVINAPEITLEINPGDGGVDPESRRATMRAWRSLGINRASFGAQTFDDRELKLLGRTHDSADVRKTFALLRDARFANINFDLIAGLPHQTKESWRQSLEELAALAPRHVSVYLLEIDEGSRLGKEDMTAACRACGEDSRRRAPGRAVFTRKRVRNISCSHPPERRTGRAVRRPLGCLVSARWW